MTLPSATHESNPLPLVLVAEDNEDNRYIAATMLRHVGYRVIEAESGSAAIRLARSERPALILMDVGDAGHRRMDSDEDTQG